MKITKRKLQAMGACAEHVALFAETFPRGTYVTLESLAKAREVGLDIEWFACQVPDDRRDEYAHLRQSARTEYNRIVQSAHAECLYSTRPAWAEYKRIKQSAWEEYEKARDAALVAAFAD